MYDLIDFCADHMANEHFTPEQVRAYMRDMLPRLNYWKKYTELGGEEKFDEFKQQLIKEFNDLHIEGMPEVTELSALIGGYVNLEYTLPNGQKVKYLDDGATYLGYQLESEFGGTDAPMPEAKDEPSPENATETVFEPYKPKIRKSGTGCVTMINDHLYEGRFTPRVNGKRISKNVYAKTREECEEKLAELIKTMKAEIAEMKW